MDKLPMNDVPMLVSAINFLLRDHNFENSSYFLILSCCNPYSYVPVVHLRC